MCLTDFAAVVSFIRTVVFNPCMRMNDLKDQTNLISSVTHSEAVIQPIEKFSHCGVGDLSRSALSRVDRVGDTHRVRGVTAS